MEKDQFEYRSQSINNKKLLQTKCYKKTKSKIEKMREKISILETILCDEKKRTQVVCEKCGAHERLKNTDLIMNFDYTEPYGCSGGDFYTPSEIHFICKECACLNRFLKGSSIVGNTQSSKNFDFTRHHVKYTKHGVENIKKKRK